MSVNLAKEIIRKHTVGVFVHEYPIIIMIKVIHRQNTLLVVYISNVCSRENAIMINSSMHIQRYDTVWIMSHDRILS